ncbi:MAG: Txe/YoeB family addiction module toxin [Tannerellaceae bacterium]|jgi:toxin YoeB|nr:Txe/YoeB family addiction module toxin [Tannerellaceae bacterium]
MEVTFSPKALKDIELIKTSGTRAIKRRFERILQSILETPYNGFASPEPLKYELSGKWSRQLSKKDRVVYAIKEEEVHILSILGHYSDK